MALFGSKKGLVGVDIGSSAVKAVELKPGGRGGEFHLVKLGLEPLPVAVIVIVLVAGLRVLSVWRGWSAPVAVDLPLHARERLVRRRTRKRP